MHALPEHNGVVEFKKIGRDLDQISRGINGKILKWRGLEAPVQVAKFASEGATIVHEHISILPSWTG
jgi:hypothetical protein